MTPRQPPPAGSFGVAYRVCGAVRAGALVPIVPAGAWLCDGAVVVPGAWPCDGAPVATGAASCAHRFVRTEWRSPLTGRLPPPVTCAGTEPLQLLLLSHATVQVPPLQAFEQP